MKIAIVGGGISGLSTYLQLQKHITKHPNLKHDIDITIYETHVLKHELKNTNSDIPSSGGGYGLAPNGMASLRRLNPEIHNEILRKGFPAPKTVMKTARGWTIGTIPFFDHRGEHFECCVMVLRQVVLDAMLERISPAAVVKKKVVEVVDGDENATLKFDGGYEAAFDLVIGADGVWSKCRRAILGERYAAEYKSLFTVGGFVSSDCLPTPPDSGVAAHCQTVMTMGPNGFFGYTPYTTGDIIANDKHIRGEATMPPGKMAFWWSRSEQQDPSANPDDAAVKRELQKRHDSWRDPAIHKILRETEVPLKVPTWVLPKLPTWAGKRIVLVGDAAHALPSSSGQGVSQALEDAEALSLLLADNVNSDSCPPWDLEALQKAFRQYMAVRKAHVEKILDTGNRLGDTSRDMNVVAEVMMYAGMWAAFKLFGAFFLKTLQNYSVVAEVEKVK